MEERTGRWDDILGRGFVEKRDEGMGPLDWFRVWLWFQVVFPAELDV
jgi:hypothetical protein